MCDNAELKPRSCGARACSEPKLASLPPCLVVSRLKFGRLILFPTHRFILALPPPYLYFSRGNTLYFVMDLMQEDLYSWPAATGLAFAPPFSPSSAPTSLDQQNSNMATASNMPRMPFQHPAFADPRFFHPSFFQGGWSNPYGGGPYVRSPTAYQSQNNGYGYFGHPSQSTALVLRDRTNADGEDEETSTPGASTSTALVKRSPLVRDTPAEYPCPPLDDPDNPPVPIHPYLYQDSCTVNWDVRTNLRHNARRADGERLSSIALKANAINAAGLNHNSMRLVIADERFPWTITVSRASGITVGDVFMEIGLGLNAEITDPEKVIAGEERTAQAEVERAANEGTGAVKTREAGDAMRRVDWLGTRTVFKGLVHSSAKEYEYLVRRRVHSHARPNTWVLVLGEREGVSLDE